MWKLFTHYCGHKIDCPMQLYRLEFIADLAKNETDRRERAKIVRGWWLFGKGDRGDIEQEEERK